jgi:hypothetical protein
MNRLRAKTVWMLLPTLLIALVVSVSFIACGKKGAAEKTGEKVDEAVEDAKDAFDKDGPVEDAGEKVDDAVDGDK